MEKASRYLNPRVNTKRKCKRPNKTGVKAKRDKTELTLDYLKSRAVEVRRPRYRSECPVVRPCPFVSCRYHLYLDVTESGSIKFNFFGMEPWEVRPSCALDAAEQLGDMTLKQIGDRMGLTRERIRQIETSALRKLEGTLDEEDLTITPPQEDIL